MKGRNQNIVSNEANQNVHIFGKIAMRHGGRPETQTVMQVLRLNSREKYGENGSESPDSCITFHYRIP